MIPLYRSANPAPVLWNVVKTLVVVVVFNAVVVWAIPTLVVNYQRESGDFDALFFPGGHGPMWDLAADEGVAKLTSAFWSAAKPVGAVCHGPAALTRAVDRKGASIFAGKKVTGFANTEEEAVGLTKVVPFLLEDKMKALGGSYERGPDWASYVVVDGQLVTGQNPASSEAAAKKVIGLLSEAAG